MEINMNYLYIFINVEQNGRNFTSGNYEQRIFHPTSLQQVEVSNDNNNIYEI